MGTSFDTKNSYRDKLRIILILYFFSEDIDELGASARTHLRKVFKSEVKIQKIDFLIRYPDYLAHELLELINDLTSSDFREDIKYYVREIFRSEEPELRREEMLRYLFGAYEEIDHTIAFFMSVGFIEFESKKNASGRVVDKFYYITDRGLDKIENEILTRLDKANWYKARCLLIRQYFGDLSGTELKVRQYAYEEYKNTPINEYIRGIQENVRAKFRNIFGEDL